MGSCMACRYSNQAPAQDGNAGLLKQALAARQMRHTQRLTQTYLTLSLADIARHVGLASPQEAEQHILRQAYMSSMPCSMGWSRRIICLCSLCTGRRCTHRYVSSSLVMGIPVWKYNHHSVLLILYTAGVDLLHCISKRRTARC